MKIKLNTNENPFPPSGLALKEIINSCNESLKLYPDPEYLNLRKTFADHNALGTENIFIGNVSQHGYALKRLNACENNILIQSMIGGQGAGGGPEEGSTIKRNIIYYVDPEVKAFINSRLMDALNKKDIDYNLYFMEGTNEAETALEKMQEDGWDQNSLAADPLFADVHNLDFSLKPESPVLKLGFKPIEDQDKIGLLNDPALPRLRKQDGLAALMKIDLQPTSVFLEP